MPPEDVVLPLAFPDAPVVWEQLGRFQAAVQFMDHHFGVLMAALDRLGLRENMLVLFTTDHGIAGPGGKGTLWIWALRSRCSRATRMSAAPQPPATR